MRHGRLFYLSGLECKSAKQSRLRHIFKHPPHQSVKRAEVDKGEDNVDKAPATSCLARVPTNSKATQLSAQHALMQGAQMHNSPFSATVRDERKC